MKIDRDKVCSVLDRISEWSLYVLIFTLPFAKTLTEATIITALIAVVLKKIIKKEKVLDNSVINILLGIFLLVSILSFFNTTYMKLSLRVFFSKSLKFAVLFLMTQEIINTRQKLDNFIKVALISCGIIVLDGLLQYYFLHYDLLHFYGSFGYSKVSLGAPTASFPFPNGYATWIITFIFPVGLCAILTKCALPKKLILWSIAIGLFYSLMLTRVRGALLAFFISFGILILAKLKKMGVLLLIILALAGLFINKSHISNLMSMNSVSDRGVIWKNSWEIFKKHPIIGNGLNTFYMEYMKIRNDEYKGTHGSYAHNCYLQMAAEIGVVGLTAFLLFVGAVVIKGFRSAQHVKDPFYYSMILGISLGLVAFLIHSSVDTDLYSLNLSALFWVSAGLLMSVIKITKQR